MIDAGPATDSSGWPRNCLKCLQKMARITVVRTGERYRITLEGRFSATDLKRLERSCHHALEHQDVPLELNFEKVLTIDATARAYLERLRARGALLRGGGESDVSPEARPPS